MTESFLKIALLGDVWVLYLLVLASIGSLAVIFERWRVFHKNRTEPVALMEGLGKSLEANDVAAALKLAGDFEGVEGRVAKAGLENYRKGAAAVEDVMSARLLGERRTLEKNLIILGTLGNNAPFVGLFGTVLGIIKAFNDLAVSGASGTAVVMAGISSALIATALGILVAIPAVVANNYYYSRLREILSNTESVSHILLSHLKSGNKGR